MNMVRLLFGGHGAAPATAAPAPAMVFQRFKAMITPPAR